MTGRATHDARRAILGLVLPIVAAVAAACGGDSHTNPAAGHGVIKARSPELKVNDTMTLIPGIQYSDGRFVAFDSANTLALDTTYASLSGSHVLRGKAPGSVTVRVTLPSLYYDSVFVIIP